MDTTQIFSIFGAANVEDEIEWLAEMFSQENNDNLIFSNTLLERSSSGFLEDSDEIESVKSIPEDDAYDPHATNSKLKRCVGCICIFSSTENAR